MPLGLIVFIAWMAFMCVTTGAFIYWALAEGHFKDIEEPKYRMLLDHELQPWPGRGKKNTDKSMKIEPRSPGKEGGDHGG